MRVLLSTQPAARRGRALLAALLLATALLSAASPQMSSAAGQIVAQQNISNTGDQSEAPQIAVGGGRLAAIWGERFNEQTGTNTTLVGSGWPGANLLNTGTNAQYQWPDIVTDGAGGSHIVYGVGNNIYHRSRSGSGGWSSAHFIASSNFPNPIRMAQAPDGTLWVVWRDADGTGIFYKFSNDGGQRWFNKSDGGVVRSETGNMFSPDVAVDQNNIPYVVWYNRSSGSFKGEIRFAYLQGDRFTTGSITNDGGSLYDADPAIAVDGNNVRHVVWRKQVGNNWTITYARGTGTSSWDSFTPLATTNGDAKYAPAIGVDRDGSVHATYSDPIGSSRRIMMYSKMPGGSWESLPISNGRWDSRSAVTGGTPGTREAHVAYQHEVGADDGEIIYVRVQFASPVQAVPQIEGSAGVTRKTSVSVSFSNVAGNPTQVRYRWGAPPTDADPWQTFANPMTIPAPSNLNTSGCDTRTLYTQVRNSTSIEQAVKSDAITFDISVQAGLRISNPHMIGLPTTYTGPGTQDTYSAGASDGDPRYTRSKAFFLGITNNGDCSGLKDFTVPNSTGTTAIPSGGYANAVPLPGDSSPGAKPISITITDNAGNSTSTQTSMIYDPPDSNPNDQIPADGAPVLAVGGSVQGDGNTQNIIRTLSFSNIRVVDNLYGKQGENLPEGQQFWGIWVANSRASGADPSTLNWYPVRVASPNSTFSIQWSLFSGISDAQRTPGTYYIYVRFLDGAGNPSLGVLTTQVALDANFKYPTQSLPLITR